MCVSLRGALGSRALSKGGQQGEIRVTPFSNGFHWTPPPTYKTLQGKRYFPEGFGCFGSTCGVGWADSGARALRVFGVLRTGMVDWKICFHPLARPCKGWCGLRQFSRSWRSHGPLPGQVSLNNHVSPLTEMVLNIIETAGSSVGAQSKVSYTLPGPHSGAPWACSTCSNECCL